MSRLDEIKARRAAGGQGAKIFAHRVVIASAAEFIAHAPDDIDWLIGEVTRLRAIGETEAGHGNDACCSCCYAVHEIRAERDRLAAELAVAVAALESGDACGAVGCRAVVERDRLAAQVRAVEALCVEAERWPAQWRSVPPARIRAALASAATPGRPRRYDQCDGTCTVDCGHCKGNGRPEPAPDTSWIKMERP